jgi:hypothetical protein
MSFVSIVGMFGLAERDHTDNFIYYDTSIDCIGSKHPIPAELRRYPVPEEGPIADNAVAYLTAKIYIPSSTSEPVLLDALETDAVPGDPASPTYLHSVPRTKTPTVFANGVVSDTNRSSTDSVVTFRLTVSEFVRNSVKQSNLLYAFEHPPSPRFPSRFTRALTPLHSCRLDKGTKRWRNVAAPTRGAQISVMGKCFDLMPNGCLSIELLNVGLSTPGPSYLPPQNSYPNSPNKRQRLLAKVPPRTFPTPTDSCDNSQQNEQYLPSFDNT